jgi:hypothetical protein
MGADDALIAQAEAAGEIEAAGQRAEVARGDGAGEALVVVGAEAQKQASRALARWPAPE